MRLPPAIARSLTGTRNVLLFLAALIAAAAGLRAVVGEPAVPQVTAKLAHFRRHAGEYDTVFVGSSRIYHQVIPELFDRITAERGFPTRSFNAGIDAMRGPEMVFFCDHLLRARPPRLRWAFVEGSPMRLHVNPLLGHNIRAVYWHDPARLWLILRTAIKTDALDLVWPHVELFAINFFNLGRGDLGRRLSADGVAPIDRQDPLGPRGDGYVPTPAEHQGMPPAMEAQYRKDLAAVLKQPATRKPRASEAQRLYDALLRRFENAGARTAVVIAPSTNSQQFALRETKTPRLVLDFAYPDRYPALFELHHRLDGEHVNNAGSAIFTRLLAEQFCDELRKLHAPK